MILTYSLIVFVATEGWLLCGHCPLEIVQANKQTSVFLECKKIHIQTIFEQYITIFSPLRCLRWRIWSLWCCIVILVLIFMVLVLRLRLPEIIIECRGNFTNLAHPKVHSPIIQRLTNLICEKIIGKKRTTTFACSKFAIP